MYSHFKNHIQSLFDLIEKTEKDREFTTAWTMLCDFEDEIDSIFSKIFDHADK